MLKHQISKTTPEHILELSRTMREADKDEVWAAAGMLPLQSLQASVDTTPHPYTGLVDGEVMNIWGVGKHPDFNLVGYPWMLASDLVIKHKRLFLRESLIALEVMKKEAPYLINMVDTRNKVAIKWLRWLGFEIYGPEAFGPQGMAFHRFTMETQNV